MLASVAFDLGGYLVESKLVMEHKQAPITLNNSQDWSHETTSNGSANFEVEYIKVAVEVITS